MSNLLAAFCTLQCQAILLHLHAVTADMYAAMEIVPALAGWGSKVVPKSVCAWR